MRRRHFIVIGGSGLLSSSSILSFNQPALAVDFSLNSIPNKNPNNIDSIKLVFDKLVLTPYYLNTNDSISVSVTLSVEEHGSVSQSIDQSFSNGNSINMLDTNINPIIMDNISSDKTSLECSVEVSVDHPDISDSYVQTFAIDEPETVNQGYYLDDWADGKLSSRDDYTITSFTPENLAPSSSSFTDPIRPEWTQEISNGINVGSGYTRLSDSTDYVMHTPLNLGGSSWDKEVNWEFQVTHDGTSNGNDRYALALTGTNYTASNNGNNDTYFTNGCYSVALNDAGRLNVAFGIDNSGDPTGLGSELIQGNSFGSGTTTKIRVKRSSDGTWELFQNGVSQGTYHDETYTNISYMGIAGDSRANVDVDYFLVY